MDGINTEVRQTGNEPVIEYLVKRSNGMYNMDMASKLAEFLLSTYSAQDILDGRADYQIANLYEVQKYITTKVGSHFSNEIMMNITAQLLKDYSGMRILNGEADARIEEVAKGLLIIENTILENREKNAKPIPLSPQKEPRKKEDIKTKIRTGILYVSTIAILATSGITLAKVVKNNNENMDNYLAGLTASVNDENYNIVLKNTDHVPYQNEQGTYETRTIYKTDGIAQDIMTLCVSNPNEYDKQMQKVYANLEYNALENMDKVFLETKRLMAQDEAFQDIYSVIENSNCFLDYLVSKGYIDTNSEDYAKVKNAIDNYKQVGSFNNLSSEEQMILKKSISNYQDIDLSLTSLGVDAGGRSH